MRFVWFAIEAYNRVFLKCSFEKLINKQMSSISRKVGEVGGTKKDQITVSLSLEISNLDI